MGSNPSKMFDDLPESSSTKQTKTMQQNSNNNLHISMEFNSYVEACSLDVDLRALDSTLQARTDHVINALAAGVEVRALSIDSLRDVTECLLEMNQQVVKVILDCKKDIWKNRDLFCLVEDYFENSLHTLDFCASLEKCLKRARDSQMLILVALQEFEEEDRAADRSSGPTHHRYSRTLSELKSFKKAGDPFTEEFFHVFHSVFQHQMRMLEKLQAKKKKLDKKLKSIQAWRKLSSIIFATTFAAVLICSIVAAAMAAPPVAAALAAAASIPLGTVGKWIDSLLMKRENAVKGQKEVVNSLNVGTYITIKDLESIGALVDKLEVDIESMMKNAEFAVGEEEKEEEDMAVKIVVEEMKKKLDAFMKNVDDLGARADNCSRDIRRARTVVLQRIIKPPAN